MNWSRRGQELQAIRDQLGSASFEAAYACGRALPVAEAVVEALDPA